MDDYIQRIILSLSIVGNINLQNQFEIKKLIDNNDSEFPHFKVTYIDSSGTKVTQASVMKTKIINDYLKVLNGLSPNKYKEYVLKTNDSVLASDPDNNISYMEIKLGYKSFGNVKIAYYINALNIMFS